MFPFYQKSGGDPNKSKKKAIQPQSHRKEEARGTWVDSAGAGKAWVGWVGGPNIRDCLRGRGLLSAAALALCGNHETRPAVWPAAAGW